jgi:hypothetical protein
VILQQLTQREAQVLVASTQPEGQMMGRRLLGDGPDYRSYKPGAAAAVVDILSELNQEQAQPALIVVLTGQMAPLRWWVEQAHLREIPVVAGTSAALEVAASPYLDMNAGQLRGVISGVSGAAYYERNFPDIDEAGARLNAMLAGNIVIVALAVIGAILYGLGSLRRSAK